MLRRQEITPRLRGMTGHSGRIEWIENSSLSVGWRLGDGALLTVVANLAPTPAQIPDDSSFPQGDALHSTARIPTGAKGDRLEPWTVIWFLDRRDPAEGRR
jgi:hypothetical protein